MKRVKEGRWGGWGRVAKNKTKELRLHTHAEDTLQRFCLDMGREMRTLRSSFFSSLDGKNLVSRGERGVRREESGFISFDSSPPGHSPRIISSHTVRNVGDVVWWQRSLTAHFNLNVWVCFLPEVLAGS